MNYSYKEYGPSGSFIKNMPDDVPITKRYKKMQSVIHVMELLMCFGLKSPWDFMTTRISSVNPRFHQFKKDDKWRVTIY